jgi:hypothetical protein
VYWALIWAGVSTAGNTATSSRLPLRLALLPEAQMASGVPGVVFRGVVKVWVPTEAPSR